MANPSALTREYDAQLRRSTQLASAYPASREVLAFYSAILTFQKSLHIDIARSETSHSVRAAAEFARLREHFDFALLLPHFRPFLALIEQRAPQPLAVAARELSALPSTDWLTPLTSYWQTGALPESQHDEVPTTNPLAQFFPRAFLQPYAAYLASQCAIPPTASTPNLCPLCGALPVLGIFRPEGDGAKRSLLCSFCGTEWNFRRLLCPHCGETDEPKLPVFVADQFPHIRTECCDTCRTYLRTIDLTKDGHAVPMVDDLGALPLSLWAHQHHYSRLYANLLST